MGIKHNHFATGANDGTKQVSVDRWNEDHMIEGPLLFPETAAPSAPSGYDLAVYSQSIAGRLMLSQKGPSGLDTSFQPNLGGSKVALWMPPGNATTVPGVFGMAALTATGTATARNVATTNLATRMTRLGYVSGATAGSLAGAREAAAKFTVGAGGGLGGFFYRSRFVISDAANVNGARMFVGLSASTAAPTNVEPNTLINSIGVCQLSTSGNLHMYCAGGAAGANLFDLGAQFPAASGSVNAYELAMFAAANSGIVTIQVTNLTAGVTVEGDFSTGIPSGATLLCHQIWRSNNATALAVGIDVCGIYMETDY